jgi:hypothetical protein
MGNKGKWDLLCFHLLLEYIMLKYRQNYSSLCCLLCIGVEIGLSLNGRKSIY